MLEYRLHSPLNITAVKSLMPPHRYTAEQAESAFMMWLADRPEAERARAKRVLRNTAVEARHSCLTIDEIFTPVSLTESSRRYRVHAVELGTRLLTETLDSAGISPREVDVLITTSCTGFMIPSVDAHMAQRLGMRPDVLRLPVTQMGCAAGASALMYAGEMLTSRPGSTAAIVNIELPTNTMQLDDYSIDNIVASALFADGLACTIVRSGGPPGPARILGWGTHHVPDSLELLGYQLTSGGFLMNLDPTLPEVVADHFEAAARSLLSRYGLGVADLRHFIVHPGGVKILDRIEAILAKHGKDAGHSRATMRRCGNMSSTTVSVILEQLLASQPEAGHGMLMSFGPGFGAHQLLLGFGSEN